MVRGLQRDYKKDAPPILDFEKEQDNIIQALDPYISEGEAIVDMSDEGTIDTLKEYLDRGGYQVLHFSGHGLFDPKKNEEYIILHFKICSLHFAILLKLPPGF